jgi:hypothetical protein
MRCRRPLSLLGILALAACGSRLAAIDLKAVELQRQDCADIAARLADAGPSQGPSRAEARACVCGARGILARAGAPLPDGGGTCPQ